MSNRPNSFKKIKVYKTTVYIKKLIDTSLCLFVAEQRWEKAAQKLLSTDILGRSLQKRTFQRLPESWVDID